MCGENDEEMNTSASHSLVPLSNPSMTLKRYSERRRERIFLNIFKYF